MLVYWGDNPDRFKDVFQHYGNGSFNNSGSSNDAFSHLVTNILQPSSQKNLSLVKELVNSSQSLVTPSHTVITNPRQACIVSNGRVDVDLDKLDLNYQPEIPIPNWQSNKEVKPYENLSKLYLDIETSGLDSTSDRVFMVGLLDEQGTRTIFTDPDEKILLTQTLKFLKAHQPDCLVGHNLFDFDLPFLMSRCEPHGVAHPFKLASKAKRITASSFNGKPIEFTPAYWRGTQILDTFQQACIWDKSAAKLTSYGLKPCCLTLKSRDERRLELSNTEIRDCWRRDDLQTLEEYLGYDLEDTQRLADF